MIGDGGQVERGATLFKTAYCLKRSMTTRELKHLTSMSVSAFELGEVQYSSKANSIATVFSC